MTITRLAILLLCFISVTSCKVSYKKNINPDVGAGFGGGGGGGGGDWPTPGVYLNAKVCLEGAVNTSPTVPGSLEMVSTLNSSGTLPYATPYTSAPWFHYSASDIALGPSIYEDGDLDLDPLTGWVDWVLVEVYSLNGGFVDAQSALLYWDGRLFNTSGLQGLFFSALLPGDYYINIKHRNHLAIANLTAVSLDAENLVLDLDFTDPLNTTTTPTLQQPIGTYQCMLAGDVDSDDDIDLDDLDFLNTQVDLIFPLAVDGTSLNGYFLTDTNFDGIITKVLAASTPDHLLINPNVGSITVVHHPNALAPP